MWDAHMLDVVAFLAVQLLVLRFCPVGVVDSSYSS